MLYAPQWARDQAQPPTDGGPAPPIEWPPRGRRLDNVRIFDERAALEARRELALQPEKVPEPPQPDPGDQIKTVLRICGVAGAAAVVAWTLVSTLDAGSPRHEPTRTSSTARPVAVAPAKPDSPPVALAARLDGNSPGSNGDEGGKESREVSRQELGEEPQESHQEPRGEAILGVPAALAASTVAAEAVPAIALDTPKAERTPPSLIIRQMDRDELALLVRRGEIFINSGDVAAARLMLQRAAEAGDVHAALALASTFDPNTIQKLGIQGLAADEAMARLWYERAAQFGSPEAPQRLQQLANQANVLP
ncbi:MAG TPA: hypothetical protein VNW48_04600 [Xanthobacteraceae bacterium]|nr:hypothetical protein [Xanthobacteraceae bacterium]